MSVLRKTLMKRDFKTNEEKRLMREKRIREAVEYRETNPHFLSLKRSFDALLEENAQLKKTKKTLGMPDRQ